MDVESMEVSIIIPTFNDWSRLSLCLKSLDNQSYPKDKYEVIVVNNNPSDVMPDDFIVPSNCTIITEAKPGSYAARNTGVRLSKGRILGFTDSDCIPHENWIAEALDFFAQNPQYTRIAGRIELFYKSEQLTDAELYEKVYAFKQDFAASKGVSVTGNMFTYRELFEHVGYFRDDLFSGGDSEWSLRAQQLGYKIGFGKKVTIYHPARHTTQELEKKYRRTAGINGNNKIKSIARLIKYSIPPINTIWHSKGLSIQEKIKVFMMRYKLHLIRSIEEIRLSFGKMPNRE